MSDMADLHFSVDEPTEAQELVSGELVVRGWAIASQGALSIRARVGDNPWVTIPNGRPRPDVARAYPGSPEALLSGFIKRFDMQQHSPGECDVTVELKSGEGVAREIRRRVKIIDGDPGKVEAFASPPGDYLRIRLEEPSEQSLILRDSVLKIGGWSVAQTGVKQVEIWIDDIGPQTAHHGLMREDVGQRYEDFPGSSHAGFLWASQINFLGPGEHTIRIVCISNGGHSLELKSKFRVDPRNEYEIWWQLNQPGTEQLIRMFDRTRDLSYAPTISIITPVYKTPEEFLNKCVNSVRRQVYPKWELILVDDNSQDDRLTSLMHSFAAEDHRIKVTKLPSNAGIAGATNAGLELATGEYVGFLDHDDELSADALFRVVETLNRDQSLDILYSDEDKIDEGGKHEGVFFKPDWSPDLLLSMNYVCHFLVCRRVLLEKVGGLRLGFDGSQDYDLILRLSEHTSRIRRVPKVIYHWRMHRLSTAMNMHTKPTASDAGRRAIQEHLDRTGLKAKVHEIGPGRYRARYEITGCPEVAVMIPTGGSPTLRKALDSLIQTTTYRNYRIVVVDNSKGERVAETLNVFQQNFSNITRVDCRELPFNFSLLCNRAAETNSAPYLLFLNDDTSVISPDWIETMLEQAMNPHVGAVGALLLFPNGTIQHAGVVTGLFEMAGHPFRGLPEQPYYFDFTHVVRNCSAVTGACLMVKRAVFESAGGFDDKNLPTCFQDVDLCLKILDAGLRVVYTPFAKLFHYESFSKKAVADLPEISYMERRWPAYINDDPYYNPNLTRLTDDYSYRYEALFLADMPSHAKMANLAEGRSVPCYTSAARKLHRFGPIEFSSPTDRSTAFESSQNGRLIQWKARGARKVQVRVGSPLGRLLAEGGATGSTVTGPWLRSGTVFYLLDASEAPVEAPERVLSVLKV